MNKRQWKKYRKKLQRSAERAGCVIKNNEFLKVLTNWVIGETK